MKQTMKIAIFGVGLIGGSLALIFKELPGVRVVGYSPNPASVEKYMKRQVVHEATQSMREAAEDADFIFLCVPVGLIETYLQELSKLKLKPGCIITDVGSTKQSVMRCAERLDLGQAHFIGGHPMAGSERSGVEAATSILFENAIYVLTPMENTPGDAYERLVGLLRHTRAQLIRLDPAEHDRVVGAISHLPHIIAVALVNQVSDFNELNDLYRLLAAGGFRDMTRIAASNPVMWRDILLNNRETILELIDDWNRRMERFARMIAEGDGEWIERQFACAGQFRSDLPERRKGVITPKFDIYLDIPDTPGILGQITTLLGIKKINISNLNIVESRIDAPGILRLSFYNEEDQARAIELLRAMDYTVYL